MEKESMKNCYKRIPMPAIGVALWLYAWYIQWFDYKIIDYVQEVILKRTYLTEGGNIDAALITALFFATIIFLAALAICVGMVTLSYEKPLFECARKQIANNIAVFGFLPTVIVSCAWDIIGNYLPAKPYDYSPIIRIDLMLDIAYIANTVVLGLATIASYAVAYANVYGIIPRARVWLNTVCGVLWVIYAYEVLFNITRYFEYGKWFLLFMLACYLVLGLAILVYKLKKESPLTPKYEVYIVELDDNKSEDDCEEYDFSIFMPTGKDKNDEDEQG